MDRSVKFHPSQRFLSRNITFANRRRQPGLTPTKPNYQTPVQLIVRLIPRGIADPALVR